MIHVLLGSNLAAMLLIKLLGDEQQNDLVRFLVSESTSSLYGSAKTLLAVRNESVALVLDADSTEPTMADRTYQDAAEVIGAWADVAPFRIFVAVPGLAALLFRCPDAVRRAYPQTSDHLIDLGLINPGIALQRIEASGERSWASSAIIKALNDEDRLRLRLEPPVPDLLEFIRQVNQGQVIPAATV